MYNNDTMISTQKTKTFLLLFITILALAHICAILALIGLVLFSPIVQEMGQGSTGVIIVGLTFITLLINTVLLLQTHQKLKTQNLAQVKGRLFLAGGIFLAYNLIVAILNPAFFQNFLISIIIMPIIFGIILHVDKQTNSGRS